VKYVLFLLAALSLLAVGGCLPGRSQSPKARLAVESVSMESLSPSSTPSALRADAQMATAKVVNRAQDPRFQREVADELGVSPNTVAAVLVQGVANTHIVEVGIDLPDAELAAKVVNAMARKLAADFRNDPEIQVRVVDTARPPRPVEDSSEK
jgi:capsular polysaccharide biosynthesis protein